MKQLLYGLSLTAILGMTSIVSLPETTSAQTNRKCSAAISRAKAKISSIRRARLREVRSFDISEEYINFPSGRPLAYSFGIVGVEDRPGRPSPIPARFFTETSQDIINNCKSVSLVQFGEYQTDLIIRFGLMRNGKVKHFKCDDSRPERLNWGYQYCG
jgi:hypothetical protein